MKEIENIAQIIQQKEEKINFENFTQKQILTGHNDTVLAINICKQRNLLASGSKDKSVKIWSLENNSLLKTYRYSGWVFDVVFSNQGNLLAYGGRGDQSIMLIDISDLENTSIFELKGHNSYIRRLKFSNDSKYLISGSRDRTIRIWDITWKKKNFNQIQKTLFFVLPSAVMIIQQLQIHIGMAKSEFGIFRVRNYYVPRKHILRELELNFQIIRKCLFLVDMKKELQNCGAQNNQIKENYYQFENSKQQLMIFGQYYSHLAQDTQYP